MRCGLSFLFLFLSFVQFAWADLPRCVFINSYHPGYAWSDRIQVKFQVESRYVCNSTIFYLDAKKEKHADALTAKGSEMAQQIRALNPAVIIASDDAASEYVIRPHFSNTSTPVVFVGINWDPRPLGYPMANATGMVEVWSANRAISLIKSVLGSDFDSIALITSDLSSEKVDMSHLKSAFMREGVSVTEHFAGSMQDWKKAVVSAQGSQAIYLSTNQGIVNWNDAEAIDWLTLHNKRFTVSSIGVMEPFVAYSLSKSPEEFGHWAGLVSKEILNNNVVPEQIPIIPNQIFVGRYNPDMLSKLGLVLPDLVKRTSVSIQGQFKP